MFSRILAVVPFALLAVAGGVSTIPESQCNTGSVSCCDQTQSTADYMGLLSTLGLADVGAIVNALVGVSCTPVTIIGLSSSCDANQSPVCCTNNEFNGAINLGCSPVNLNV
ncbi:hypothetical protein HYDPIDRAFT_137833 [Hydnomerulius pinastri MD-312]|uniref:Hydrophobin n=1 Tax=Hydnomerulius pinastri MD-312 TaxID=994086 RepID=A0A0C9WCA6_9AGAM|nr:hypothetical protein HYDPIDRAFT_137833 [Hydnomerulius pinastri MD-312]